MLLPCLTSTASQQTRTTNLDEAGHRRPYDPLILLRPRTRTASPDEAGYKRPRRPLNASSTSLPHPTSTATVQQPEGLFTQISERIIEVQQPLNRHATAGPDESDQTTLCPSPNASPTIVITQHHNGIFTQILKRIVEFQRPPNRHTPQVITKLAKAGPQLPADFHLQFVLSRLLRLLTYGAVFSLVSSELFGRKISDYQ